MSEAKTYQLHQRELDFLMAHISQPHLREVLKRAKENGSFFVQGRYDTGKYRVTITKEDAERIVDYLSNLLCEIGLKSNSEPNSIGLYIENLIDTFTYDTF